MEAKENNACLLLFSQNRFLKITVGIVHFLAKLNYNAMVILVFYMYHHNRKRLFNRQGTM